MRNATIATLLVTAGLGGTFAAAGDVVQGSYEPTAAGERRVAPYHEFRRLYAAGRYGEAVPLAQAIVRMLEDADPGDGNLPGAWNNLGTTQLRAGDPASAIPSFLKAIDLLEATESISSRRLIAPLGGLGAAYAALDRHDLAAASLRHALAISRRADGLLNVGQLDLLEALVTSYEVIDDAAGIDRERRYAVQVVQQAYGPNDPRTVPMLSALADWYAATNRYAPARELYQRVVEIASVEDGGRNAATITGLLGVARSHRLQYVDHPESIETPHDVAAQSPAVPGGTIKMRVRLAGPEEQQVRILSVKLDSAGLAALTRALEILDSLADPPAELLAEVLLELGDWYIAARDTRRAIEAYERAWPLFETLATDAAPNPLRSPRAVAYRPPFEATRSRSLSSEEAVERNGEFVVDVAADGFVSGVARVGGDLSLGRGWLVQKALAHSRFSPRFEDGKPVATASVPFSQGWFESLAEIGPLPPAAEATAEPKPDPAAEPEMGPTAPIDPAGVT